MVGRGKKREGEDRQVDSHCQPAATFLSREKLVSDPENLP
jgi:hypothetical protein